MGQEIRRAAALFVATAGILLSGPAHSINEVDLRNPRSVPAGLYPLLANAVQRDGLLSRQTKLTSSDRASSDYFGVSVAISGDTMVVAAIGNDDAGRMSGSAYVFQRSGTGWIQQAKLTASDGAAEDVFGWSAAISGDTVVVGARRDDDAGKNSGSAYVFQRSGTAWTQQAKLTASDGAAHDNFGGSVAISGDTVVVGAVWDDDAGKNSGSAYVFQRSGTGWTQRTKLMASDGAADDYFGGSVAIGGDTVVVSASGDDDAGERSGSAYVFQRGGTGWIQQAKLTASDGAAGDCFGSGVAISGDTVVVGACTMTHVGKKSGSAYVFQRSGTAWTQQAKLTSSDGAAEDQFGSRVAISGDTVVVGAVWDDDAGENFGAFHVFQRSGTAWTRQAKITASDGATDDNFGSSVAIGGDTVVVGASGDDGHSGSAYVF